jgi:uncharacterized protein YqeY
MLTKIADLLKGFFDAINIFERYFPPKSTEQKVEDATKEVRAEIEAEEKSGRPS